MPVLAPCTSDDEVVDDWYVGMGGHAVVPAGAGITAVPGDKWDWYLQTPESGTGVRSV